jgi:Fe-S-cluster containining protein
MVGVAQAMKKQKRKKKAVPLRERSPQQKMDWIMSTFGNRMNALINEAIGLVENRAHIEDRAQRMVQLVNELVRPAATASACKRGCSHCCYQAVTISAWDAARMAHASGMKLADPEGMNALTNFDETRAEQKRWSGKPCPFLKGNECSVYDVRPFPCRWHFNLGDDPAVCDTINNPGHKVPMFNCEPVVLSVAVMFANAGVKWADIRDFFPTT